MEKIDKTVKIYEIEKKDEIGKIHKFDTIDEIGKMNEIGTIDEINKIDEIVKIDLKKSALYIDTICFKDLKSNLTSVLKAKLQYRRDSIQNDNVGGLALIIGRF